MLYLVLRSVTVLCKGLGLGSRGKWHIVWKAYLFPRKQGFRTEAEAKERRRPLFETFIGEILQQIKTL